ncbi:UDP-N-acetylenolpyruvoylglucosamine reductase [subsurface metagenome]|jgi:UDP-N-acetylmuramate dehydrogenase
MLVIKNRSFKEITSFRIGGKIRNLYVPVTIEDLKHVFSMLKDTTFYLIGAGTNILASEQEFQHVVTMKMFNKTLKFHGNHLIAYAGNTTRRVAIECAKHSLSGFEFLIDVPGLIGGAIVMNAGCFGREVSQMLEEITFLTVDGEIQPITDFHFKRRYCDVQERKGAIIAGKFKLQERRKAEIETTMQEYTKYRRNNQPLRYPSAGGIFKNYKLLPKILPFLKNSRIGDAEICMSAPNWILNKGKATSTDVMQLICNLQTLAKEKLNENLELEIKVLP